MCLLAPSGDQSMNNNNMKKLNNKEIGAVLTFRHHGAKGTGGQTVGADGTGTFCVIFTGGPSAAEIAAYKYARKLDRCVAGISDVCIVADIEGYFGSPYFCC